MCACSGGFISTLALCRVIVWYSEWRRVWDCLCRSRRWPLREGVQFLVRMNAPSRCNMHCIGSTLTPHSQGRHLLRAHQRNVNHFFGMNGKHPEQSWRL